VRRVALVRHLKANGCELLREGRRHSVFVHRERGTVTTVPRHREINDLLARKICRDLDVAEP
jgi:predicted RNA binding protein YcfA (HicA-like mRNA interferase family)